MTAETSELLALEKQSGILHRNERQISCPEDRSVSRKTTDYGGFPVHRSNAIRSWSDVIRQEKSVPHDGEAGPHNYSRDAALVVLAVHVIEHGTENAADDTAFGSLADFAPCRHVLCELMSET